jgi:hypothetical protein
MLSTEQKKLKEKQQPASGKFDSDHYAIRKATGKYDIDRVTELWANLTMIQQMQGNDHWMKASQKSGLSWGEYIERLLSSRASKVIVFENRDLIFGFAYMVLEPMNFNNAKQKPKLKAVIKEIYLEPAYREQGKSEEMAEMMRQCLLTMNIDYFEFDVKDL